MNQASAQYIQRLDLGEDPFTPEFTSNYFYGGASRRQLLDQIIHLCRFGNHVVVVTGNTGSGTSTLLDTTFSQLQPLMDCCHINAQLLSTPRAILESLAEQLRLDLGPAVSTEDFILALNTCSPISTEPEPILFAFDQAHYLELEGFECLLELVQRAQNTVRLLLVGEHQIEELAQLAGFVDERMKVFELESLTLSEIDEYLMGLLSNAGYAGNQPLSSDQLTVLHEQSGGNIADINRLVPRMLVDEGNQKERRFKLAIPRVHLVAIGVLALALVLSYFYQGETGSTNGGVITREIAVLPVQRAPVEKQKKLAVKSGISILSEVQAPINTRPAISVSDNQVVRKWVQVEENSIEKPKPIETVVDKKVSRQMIQKQEPQEKAVAHASITTPVKKVSKPTPRAKKEQRLLGLPVTAYMLQLMGSVEEKRSRGFVKQYVGRLAITYIEVKRNGKPWYIVLTGPYSDRDAAVVGVSSLPEALQRQKPWARSVGSIQELIHKKH